jgi:hypothetical protein
MTLGSASNRSISSKRCARLVSLVSMEGFILTLL